ncbi:MAG: molybdopterin-synthase adenylyltransferase MoeB [Thermaerobacter sp.]|nr:molybdopterin-synthase adenylyltransferase MoeB [Thermaerobacter sp.]
MFTEEQIRRYSRHILLPEVGGAGQRRLLAARVLLLGAGGLGSPTAYYLAAAGVGTLGICDPDVVDLSNLQRQILHAEADLGRPKVDSAAEKLRALNPDVRVVCHRTGIDRGNALDLLADYDLVVDGTDNFATRYLVADACHLAGKPLVHGSIFRFEGQVTVFLPGEGPCYRCLYPEPPPAGLVPSCQEAGVLGVLPGIIGTVQAAEAIKLLLGIGRPLVGRLLTYDALEMDFHTLAVHRDPACSLCGDTPSITALGEYGFSCEVGACPTA